VHTPGSAGAVCSISMMFEIFHQKSTQSMQSANTSATDYCPIVISLWSLTKPKISSTQSWRMMPVEPSISMRSPCQNFTIFVGIRELLAIKKKGTCIEEWVNTLCAMWRVLPLPKVARQLQDCFSRPIMRAVNKQKSSYDYRWNQKKTKCTRWRRQHSTTVSAHSFTRWVEISDSYEQLQDVLFFASESR